MTKIHFEAPSPEDYCNLRANAGMSSKSIEAAIKGLPHACFNVTLYENDMLIGMGQAVCLLGRPDKAYPILHVTGTNGKGSTIAFLRQLLMAQGKKVGTFTSPHMISIHDRICIGDQPISDEDFTRIGQEVQQMEQTLLQTQDQLSYFEIICLMALLYFKEQAVDVEIGRASCRERVCQYV